MERGVQEPACDPGSELRLQQEGKKKKGEDKKKDETNKKIIIKTAVVVRTGMFCLHMKYV